MKQLMGWIAVACLFLSGPVHAGSLGGIYLHSDALAKQVDSIDSAVQSADTLKSYDDQLANLTAFGAKEDLAVAMRTVAERDADLLGLIGQPTIDPKHQDARIALLLAEACERIANLSPVLSGADPAPATPCQDPNDHTKLNFSWLKSRARLERVIGDLAGAQAAVDASIQRFARRFPNLPAPTCDGAEKEAATKDVQADQEAVSALQDLAETQCVRVSNDKSILGALGWPPADNSIGAQVMQASDADQTAANAAAAAALSALTTQLNAVQAAARKKTDLAMLQTIESDLNTALSTLDPVEKLAGLTSVQGKLDEVEAALTCGTTCTSPPTASVGVKAAAVEGMLNALARNADVAAGRGAVANWIAAAQAIVASYKADVQVEKAADDAMAAITARRQALNAHELSLLSKTAMLAAGDFQDVTDVSGCSPATAFDCALPTYVASWNEGRAPAALLDYRQVQVFRAFVVQRQRQAAQAQRSVLLAATATLKAYGDGGVQPQAIAQLIGALGIVAIAAK